MSLEIEVGFPEEESLDLGSRQSGISTVECGEGGEVFHEQGQRN